MMPVLSRITITLKYDRYDMKKFLKCQVLCILCKAYMVTDLVINIYQDTTFILDIDDQI